MRAPSPSFRSAIAEIRAWVVQQRDDAVRPQLLAILDRWKDHPDVDKSWVEINQVSLSPPDPREFISWILRLWRAVQETKRFADTVSERESKWRSLAKRDFDADRDMDAYIKKKAAIKLRNEANAALGRKQADAHFQQFMRECSGMIMNNCGKPLDSIVAGLTSIAFDRDVTSEMVRGARKSRDIRAPK